MTQGDVEGPILRVADVADAADIETVHWAGLEAAYMDRVVGWPEAPRDIEARTRTWIEWVSDPEIDVIVAVSAARIVGFCSIRPGVDNDVDPRREAEMPTLYVHPLAWRRGCGTALCRAAEARARERGFMELFLWVLDVNERAVAFYRHLGFEPDGGTKLDAHTAERLVGRRYRMALGAPSG